MKAVAEARTIRMQAFRSFRVAFAEYITLQEWMNSLTDCPHRSTVPRLHCAFKRAQYFRSGEGLPDGGLP